ncbi:uncharacterized protein ASCRUDRAFT_76113 [Ascoidea rubescens DSM 1968]|uniref:Uncharacterized protein n=1 Tax=Ascoidea rubescens DSM 1968 TaxID=1344418 RepID=A0A1D2VGX8_9ASCO|nr:hypothetical protein ASCRUDRAFT_76113 [Ascoidea rubescens DSM 1968]ODV60743.1 hypothetical protein ASCRUDRAFT_76113 [Ascoidea rubescens DSM 1968]
MDRNHTKEGQQKGREETVRLENLKKVAQEAQEAETAQEARVGRCTRVWAPETALKWAKRQRKWCTGGAATAGGARNKPFPNKISTSDAIGVAPALFARVRALP